MHRTGQAHDGTWLGSTRTAGIVLALFCTMLAAAGPAAGTPPPVAFAAAVTYATGAGTSPQWVAIGDFDLDGNLDVVTANNGTANVSVLLGNGDGTLDPAATYAAFTAPRSVAIGDVDLDGNPDLAVANNTGTGDVSILLGNGDGTFDPPVTFTATVDDPNPFEVVIGDLNLDNKPDLAVTNNNGSNLTRRLGTGGGSPLFGTAARYTTLTGPGAGSAPRGLALGDLNEDGNPDLAAANNGSPANIALLFGNGDGTFDVPPTAVAVGTSPHSVTIGDLNLDGDLDIVSGNSNDFNLFVRLGNGDGTFDPAPTLTAGSGPIRVVIGDFNLDGNPDLATANVNSHNVSVFPGDGTGSFGARTDFAVSGFFPSGVAMGDLNEDGKPDLVSSNGASNTVSVLLNTTLVDETDPTVTIVTPVEGDAFQVGQVVNADYSCADETALASCVGTVPDGSAIDTASAGAKTFTVTATDGSGNTTVQTVNYTVVSGAALGSLAVADLAASEGSGGGTTPFVVTVGRTGDTSLTAYVNVSTANYGAAAPGDYTAIAPTQVRFAPGDTTKTVTVDVVRDSIPETNEALLVKLASAVNATIADSQATIKINNDDAGTPATLAATNVTLAEGNTGTTAFVFTVTRSGELSETSSVSARTASVSALPPGDYTDVPPMTVTFAPGETSKTFTVQVNGDTIPEHAETFYFELNGRAVNALIADDRGTGTITNDDAGTPATLAATNVTVDEGDTGTTLATFTVTRSGNLTETVQVKYQTVNGTATSPSDYAAATGFLVFAPGETTKTVDITINGDTDVEPDQTFTLKLPNAKNAKVTRNGKGTIRNDD